MFEEEEPGKPKNWGCTITIIILIILLNISIIIVCRILLDSHDEKNNHLLKEEIRENLTLFLGMFALSFCFFCCCCFCCGGALCQWIAKCHSKCFDPSKLLSTAIKTIGKTPEDYKKRKKSFFINDASNGGNFIKVNAANDKKPKRYVNYAVMNSSKQSSPNNSNNILTINAKELAKFSSKIGNELANEKLANNLKSDQHRKSF